MRKLQPSPLPEYTAGRRLFEAQVAGRCPAPRKRNFLKKVSLDSSKTFKLNIILKRK
jgi:hypothetical protein